LITHTSLSTGDSSTSSCRDEEAGADLDEAPGRELVGHAVDDTDPRGRLEVGLHVRGAHLEADAGAGRDLASFSVL
jgi:hypothetical protein